MAITTLDAVTALVVIDLQKGILSRPLAHPAATVLAHNRGLLAAFRARHLPVVLVNVAGQPQGRTSQPRFDTSSFPADWTELVPELEAQPSDIKITKHSWGPFATTGIEQKLRHLGVTQLVITGVATSIGVESTARQAFDLGFNVALPSDAMTDMRADTHGNSVGVIFPRLGEVGTSHEVIALLEKAAARS